MNFSFSSKVKDLQRRLQVFMDEHIYPKQRDQCKMCAVFLREAMDRVEVSARNVIGAWSAGHALRENMATLRGFANYDPLDGVALRRKIAGRLLVAARYTI